MLRLSDWLSLRFRHEKEPVDHEHYQEKQADRQYQIALRCTSRLDDDVSKGNSDQIPELRTSIPHAYQEAVLHRGIVLGDYLNRSSLTDRQEGHAVHMEIPTMHNKKMYTQ